MIVTTCALAGSVKQAKITARQTIKTTFFIHPSSRCIDSLPPVRRYASWGARPDVTCVSKARLFLATIARYSARLSMRNLHPYCTHNQPDKTSLQSVWKAKQALLGLFSAASKLARPVLFAQ